MKRFTVIVLAAIAGITLLAGNSMADPIFGNLALDGNVQLSKSTTALVSSNVADSVAVYFTGNVADAGVHTGVFSSGPATAIINNFTFLPASDPVVNPLWVYGTFSFSMDSIEVKKTLNEFGGDELKLYGTGMVTSTDNNFDATFGDWLFTTQVTPAGSSGTFSWSSHSSVPEPASAGMVLLGAGIVGFAGVTRGRKIKK